MLPALLVVVEGSDGSGKTRQTDAVVDALCARGLGRIPSSVARLGPGIDIRAAGGYVVAPPSWHALGRRYAWELSSDPFEGCEPAPVPAWIVDAARAPSTARGARVAPGDVIGQGQRNDTLARYACSLRARGVEEVELREAVERVTSATSFEASTLCEGKA